MKTHLLAASLLGMSLINAPLGASAAPGQAWNTRVQNHLEQFASQVKPNQVAVFDADGTLWKDDVGEGFLKWLIKHKKLANQDPSRDYYGEYEKMCDVSHLQCYGYAVQLMAGMKESDVKKWSAEYFKAHFVKRVFQGQKKLIQTLQKKGAKVWIVSASHQWIVEAGAPYLNVPLKQVVGIRVKVNQGLLTNELIAPVTYRPGKVKAIQKFIGKVPVLVSGNSMTDFEMLNHSSGVSLVINPKNKGQLSDNLALQAQQKGWLVQHW